jgi:hypothetical protein
MDRELSTTGEAMWIFLRIAGPLLFGLAVLQVSQNTDGATAATGGLCLPPARRSSQTRRGREPAVPVT